MRSASNNVENAYARSLLFLKRIRTGEWQIELRELKAVVGALLSKLGATIRKVTTQPTVADKVYLLGELAWDNKLKVAACLSLTSLIMNRRR